jgi:hypothetical protein
MISMLARYDDHGIRFEHPASWELEQDEDDARVTISVQSPSGLAFVMITVDADRPSPAEMVEETVSAMREEYPGVEVVAVVDEVGGYRAEGFDLEFFALDLVSACSIRAFRTPLRTILVFGQWSALDEDDEEPEAVFGGVLRTLEETDEEG